MAYTGSSMYLSLVLPSSVFTIISVCSRPIVTWETFVPLKFFTNVGDALDLGILPIPCYNAIEREKKTFNFPSFSFCQHNSKSNLRVHRMLETHPMQSHHFQLRKQSMCSNNQYFLYRNLLKGSDFRSFYSLRTFCCERVLTAQVVDYFRINLSRWAIVVFPKEVGIAVSTYNDAICWATICTNSTASHGNIQVIDQPWYPLITHFVVSKSTITTEAETECTFLRINCNLLKEQNKLQRNAKSASTQ